MLLSFELTMPNVGSWNGKWTGEDKKYYVIRKMSKSLGDNIMKGSKTYPIYTGIFNLIETGRTALRKSYYYNFGDGWGANITVEEVDSSEAAKRRKLSSGFYGYEWMIDSIILHDEIIIPNEN